MCLICVDFQREAMTAFEARRALGEMKESLDAEHVREVEKMLREAEAKAARDQSAPKSP